MPSASRNVYRPEEFAVIDETRVNRNVFGSRCHKNTVAPARPRPLTRPEIVTGTPAVDGSGTAWIDTPRTHAWR